MSEQSFSAFTHESRNVSWNHQQFFQDDEDQYRPRYRVDQNGVCHYTMPAYNYVDLPPTFSDTEPPSDYDEPSDGPTQERLSIPSFATSNYPSLGAQALNIVVTSGYISKPSLVSLARTSTALMDPALNLLWAEMDSILPLLKLLPSFKVEDDSFVLSGPVWDHDMVRLEVYGRRIRHFSYLGDKLPLIAQSAYIRVAQLLKATPLMPNLRHFYVVPSISLPSPHLTLFLSPSIRSFEIYNVSSIARNDIVPFLESMPFEAPFLERLVLQGTERLSLAFLSKWKNLRHLKLLKVTHLQSFDFLHTVGSLPHLEDLILDTRDLGYQSSPLVKSFGFYELRVLMVTGPFNLIRDILHYVTSRSLQSLDITFVASEHQSPFLRLADELGPRLRTDAPPSPNLEEYLASNLIDEDIRTAAHTPGVRPSDETQPTPEVMSAAPSLEISFPVAPDPQETKPPDTVDWRMCLKQSFQIIGTKWPISLRSFVVDFYDAKPTTRISPKRAFDFPTGLLFPLTNARQLESLCIFHWKLTYLDENLRRLAPAWQFLTRLNLPTDKHGSQITLMTLRHLACSLPRLRTVEAIIDITRIPPFHLPARYAFLHGLRNLSAGSLSVLHDYRDVVAVARHLNILFPNVEISPRQGQNENQWQEISYFIRTFQGVRDDDRNRASFESIVTTFDRILI